MEKGTGLRRNEGKTRYDLVPAFAQEQYAKVLTLGANKYAERNWEAGMKWSKVLASLERHLAAVKRGEDYDPETGALHSAHIMCNAAFLTEYYRVFPEGDDRPKTFLNAPRVALDIDDVCADFTGAWRKRFGITQELDSWNFSYQTVEHWSEIIDDVEFWMAMDRKIDPCDLMFEPVAYITARPLPKCWVEDWLEVNNFPTAPVVITKTAQDKLDAIREFKVDYFVDDKFETFAHINRNGGICFLMDAPHNRRYDVGHMRVHHINEVITGERNPR